MMAIVSRRSGVGTSLVALALLDAAAARAQAPANDEPPPPAPQPDWAPPLPEQEQLPSPTPTEPQQPPAAKPEAALERKPELEIYGFAMLDIGYDFGSIGDPQWEDVVRPTKLPSTTDQFGKGGRTFVSVRQSRFGVSGLIPTDKGDIKTKFEFELFGVGVDAGQTTFRLRHAYGEWHGLRAGQTWSPFMDPDVFPDSIEYWGPNGMVFFRNVQVAYVFYKQGDSDVTVALERPGASADSSSIGERFDLTNVVPRFPMPDISADVKLAGSNGTYVRLSGILRYMRWDDLSPTPIVEGHAWGWGLNLSSNIKWSPFTFKLQAVYGEGIENYMNDAGADIAPKADPAGIPTLEGQALRVFGLVAFVDVKWCDLLTSSVGYSYVHIDNSSGQEASAFHSGHYALGNLLFHPVKPLMLGPEFQYGRRENHSDGFSVNDYRIQFSIKYSFGAKVRGL